LARLADRFRQGAADVEVLRRTCSVEDHTGRVEPLVTTFFVPLKNPEGEDYLARATIRSSFFEKDVYAIGEDAAQAFFSLPICIVSYLVGQRRFGFEAYWLEKGDLDQRDFWTYRR
jgi:hypothetical protein